MEPYERLEVEVGAWAGYPPENVVACASGGSALWLALEALRLPAGSEVVCPTFAMVACARAVVLAGLRPVFIDCREDLGLGPDLVREAIGPNDNYEQEVVALLAIHIYGRRCDMTRVALAANRYHFHVIEDLAEAHGVRPHPDTDAACWSFYRNKIVAGEEGGAVAFRDPAVAALARSLRCYGFTEAHDFEHTLRGWNHRLSNANATLVLQSLRMADHNLAARREIEGWYDAACPPEWRMPRRDVVWVYDLRVPGLTRERQTAVVRALNAAGIAARMGFHPLHLQPEFRGCRVVGGGVAERMARECFYLPVQPGITTPDACRAAFDVICRHAG